MANTKEYQIKINGISESINAVDSLNNKLQNLEQRINTINTSKVSSAGGSSSSSNASSLSEEEKLAKQIEQIDQKREAYSKEIYQNYLKGKDALSETVKLQKENVAAERLTANNYTNTMQGMKQHLADLKAVINVTDLGDTDKIKEMTQEANNLANKLKEMEQAYGQFGRNVGNYKDVANGFKGLAIQIGDTTQNFDNAKQALKELKKERDTLSAKKDLGLISEEEVKRLKDLIPVVAQLQSSIQDAGKPMDALMDTMQSFVAIAQASKGIGAFFGIDDTEIQKSIQQLVALQNALQGLQTIQKQIQSGEGVGGWIKPFIAQIDIATAKTLKFNTALLGTGKASKIAAVGIKTFSKALKVAFSAGVLIVVDLLIEGVMKLVESFKKVDEAAEREKAVQKDLAETYGNAQGKLIQYKTKVDEFNGSKKEEKKLVEELNKEFGETLGTFTSLAKWQDVLKKKGDAYIQTLVNQAKVQAALNEVTAAYMNLEDVKQKKANGDYKHWYQTQQQDKEAEARAIEEANKRITKAEANLKKVVEENDKYAKDNKLGDYSPQIKKGGKNTEDAIKNVHNTLNNLELRLMQDGLNKRLRELDNQENETIAKLKKLGKKAEDEIKKTQEVYNKLRKKEIEDYLKELYKSVSTTVRNINNLKLEVNIGDAEKGIDSLKNKFEEISKIVPNNMSLTTRTDLKNIIGNVSVEDMRQAYLFDVSKLKGDATLYNKVLDEYLSKQDVILKKYFEAEKKEIGESGAYDWIAEKFEKDYAQALSIVRSYNIRLIDLTEKDLKENENLLSNSFTDRLFSSKLYYEKGLKLLVSNIKQQEKLEKEKVKNQMELDSESERERYRTLYNNLTTQENALNEEIALYEKRNDKDEKVLEEMKNKRDTLQKQIQDSYIIHSGKMQQIADEMNNNIKKIELDTQSQISSVYEKYYSLQITNYREFQSKLNNEMNKNPITDKDWGIVNIAETKRNYREIITASETTLKQLQKDKEKLNSDYRGGLISDEVFNETLTNFNDLETSVTQGLQETNEKSKQIISSFIQSIDQYLQAVVGSFNQIMSAVWDAQDNANDKEAEALDKANEILEDKLSKQQEIVEKHKSKIDSIEDELQTARGDRRQHLIDQLNAEMRAQREAQAQEKKIEKEKEANERKQDDLEKKRKKQQYHRDMLQAVVNGAMAVTYALVNKWPIPAIPMAALAASTAAAQIGIMAANKPYAKGGLLEGKSHAEGGIPVGNTGIEVEGKEYIIRKKSTAPNIEILDYINKSERKLDLDDFIEFYSSGKVKKNITQISPKSRFADGGTIPTLNSDYSFDDRLLNAFEDYSNRPVYVSVQDINSRQKAVKNVQVLAGIQE